MTWPLAPSTTTAASLAGAVAAGRFFGAAFARALRVRWAASAGSKLAKEGARTEKPTTKPTRILQLIRLGPFILNPLALDATAVTKMRPNCQGDCKALTWQKD